MDVRTCVVVVVSSLERRKKNLLEIKKLASQPTTSKNGKNRIYFFYRGRKETQRREKETFAALLVFFSEKFVIFSLCSVLFRNCCVDIESTGYQKPLVIICELDQENLSACSEEWFFVELKLFLSLVFVGCDRLELKKHHSLFSPKACLIVL